MKILITGGNSGIGAAIVKRLKIMSYDILSPKRTELDVIYWDEVELYIRENKNEIWAIVNCAGVNYLEHIGKLDHIKSLRLFDVNVLGYISTINYGVKHCPNLRRIINIGSIASRIPMRCSLLYNASKAAVDMITRQSARELAPKIAVFGVNPGKMYPSKMSDYVDQIVPELRGWDEEKAKEYQLNAIPMGRTGDAAEVANLVNYLLIGAPEYMTGSVIEIAGGM